MGRRMVRTDHGHRGLDRILRQSPPAVRVLHRREGIQLAGVAHEEVPVREAGHAEVPRRVRLEGLVDHKEAEAVQVAASMGIPELVQRSDDNREVLRPFRFDLADVRHGRDGRRKVQASARHERHHARRKAFGDTPHQLERLIVRRRRDQDHLVTVGVPCDGPFGRLTDEVGFPGPVLRR